MGRVRFDDKIEQYVNEQINKLKQFGIKNPSKADAVRYIIEQNKAVQLKVKRKKKKQVRIYISMIRQPLKRKKKKGQIQHIAFFLILIFSIVFLLLISKYILTEFNSALEDDGMHTTESRKSLVDMSVAFPTFDNMILVVIVFLGISLIVTSFFIPTHPIFLVINVFGIFFLAFLGMLLSNMYKDMIDASPELASVYGTFPKLTFIMNQLPWIACILVFIMTIVQYSRYRSENG